ncbi:putative L-aspartate oxidase, chloroplastic-like [Capsicum annuum]|nr:putative L-aspartate oxidase, chloroplastic-like [Capsicum annuum]
MEAVIATALLGSSDDSSEDQELDINRMYIDVVGGAKKWCVYGLGSQASTLYKDQNSVNSTNLMFDHVAEERIKILEKEVSQMRENQERVLQERVEAEVQQRVEQEFSV